jgi:hypothetical protein
MATSCLAMTIELYPFFLVVCLNHLVCLHHLNYGVPLDLAVTTALLWAIGIALCCLVARSWCPTSGFGSWDHVSYLPTFARSMMSWTKEYRFHSFSSLVVNPYRSSEMWVEPFAWWCLLLLVSIPSISINTMASGLKEGKSRVFFCLLALSCSSPGTYTL